MPLAGLMSCKHSKNLYRYASKNYYLNSLPGNSSRNERVLLERLILSLLSIGLFQCFGLDRILKEMLRLFYFVSLLSS